MKKNLYKTIFSFSFLPYLLVFIYGVICFFNGITYFFNEVYGIDAFLLGVFISFYYLTLLVPVIPICFIYQIFYIIRKLIKKVKKCELKNYNKICFIIGSILVIGIMFFSYSFEIKKVIEKASAKQMINRAEEKIGFNKNDIIVSGIFNIPEYRYSHIFIDYDKMEIGFLINASVDEFWKTKLQKTTNDSLLFQHIIRDYYMQVDISLNSPGKRLVSFYSGEDDSHRTIAILLFDELGNIYFADNLKEKDTGFTRYTGLKWSEFFVGENVKFTYEK